MVKRKCVRRVCFSSNNFNKKWTFTYWHCINKHVNSKCYLAQCECIQFKYGHINFNISLNQFHVTVCTFVLCKDTIDNWNVIFECYIIGMTGNYDNRRHIALLDVDCRLLVAFNLNRKQTAVKEPFSCPQTNYVSHIYCSYGLFIYDTNYLEIVLSFEIEGKQFISKAYVLEGALLTVVGDCSCRGIICFLILRFS